MSMKSSAMFSLIMGILFLSFILDNVNSILSSVLDWFGIIMMVLFKNMFSKKKLVFLFFMPVAYVEFLYLYYARSFFSSLFPFYDVVTPLWYDLIMVPILASLFYGTMFIFIDYIIIHFKIRERVMHVN